MLKLKSVPRIAKYAINASALAGLSLAFATPAVQAQDAQLEKALGYATRIPNVEYQKVDPKDVTKCKGSNEQVSGVNGYLVTGPNGETLRWFADTNKDKSVDQWSYYNNSVEVHREMDTNGNGVADQFRWLGTAGTRWGIDANEDGVIDTWKQISAEEVSVEIVEAIRDRNLKHFESLLISPKELTQLGIAEDKNQLIVDRIKNALKDFNSFASSQKTIDKSTKWSNFAADKPGVIPAGTDGSTKDLVAYDSVVAVVEDGQGKPQQVMIGSLVQVEGGWRATDLPKLVTSGAVVTEGGLFFPASSGSRDLTAAPAGMTPQMQALLEELDVVDKKILSGTPKDKPVLHSNRADLLEKLITSAPNDEERTTWVRQFADTVSAASQSGEFPDGLKRLQKVQREFEKSADGKDLAAYVAFRVIEVDYQNRITEPNANYQKIEKDHLEQLEQFTKTYPRSEDAAEAFLRIGLSNELAGNLDDAQAFYNRAAKDFPKTSQGEKASGAVARLNLKGQKMRLTGETLDGKKFDSSTFGARPIIVHYWASWCEPCKADMKKLRQLQAKYAREGLTIVGINVDDDPKDAIAFLKGDGSDITWQHLYEKGGMESNLAAKLGVLSLPVTLIIDPQGKVAVSTTHFSPDLEETIESMTSAKK